MEQQSQFHGMTLTQTSAQYLNRAQKSYMLEVRQSLAQIIVSLQSDQLLQQMRNDSTLYEQKMTYIQQLIHTHFTPEPINSKLIQQLQSMNEKCKLLEANLEQRQRKIIELQSKLQQSKDEYISQLNNIELQYKEFLVEKQRQQQQMTKTLQQKQQTIMRQKSQIQSLNIQLNKVKSTLEKQVQFLHSKLLGMNKINQKLLTENQLLDQANAKLNRYEEDNQLQQRKLVKVEYGEKKQEGQSREEKIDTMHNHILQTQILQLQTHILQLQTQITTLKQKLTTNQKHSIQLQQSLTQLTQHQEQYKSTIQQMKQHQQEYKLTIQQMNQHQQEYKSTIQQMKEHMFLIKQQWEKKCLSIEEGLSQQYHQRLVEVEENMRQQLDAYVAEMGQGKTVVIQSSQQVMESKRLLMERKFDDRIKQIQQQYHIKLNQYLEQTKTLQNQLLCKQRQIEQLQHKLDDAQTHLQSLQLEWSNKQHQMKNQITNLQNTFSKTKLSHINIERQMNNKLSHLKLQTDNQIQRLRRTQVMLLRDIKQQKQQKQQLQTQLTTSRLQLSTLQQTHLQQLSQLKQLQSLNQNQHTKILQLKKDLVIMNEKSILDQRALKDKNQQIFRLESHVNQLKMELKEIDNMKRKIDVRLAECIVKMKENDRLKNEMAHKVEKTYLLVRKLAKELLMVKQDIHYQITSQKTKLRTITMQLSQQLSLREDSIKYSYKLKTQQLLEQVQNEKTSQRRQLQEIIRENSNMKKEIKLLEQVMREKDEDHLYQKERLVSLEVEKCRVLMQEEVDREKEEKRKLEEKLYSQQKKHDYLMAKAEKQVHKAIKLFISKWQLKLTSFQQALQASQSTIKQLTKQLKMSDSEINDLHHEIKQKDEKLTKLEKKYQMLKQQRDKTVDEMMRRLEKETKHKLSLEREMKHLRAQDNRTQTYTTVNNSPFNNYSFTDRENPNVYTNAFQATTHEKATKTQIKATNRQKELSQIREMIAKTYKVVQGPEKGSPVHKGKLF